MRPAATGAARAAALVALALGSGCASGAAPAPAAATAEPPSTPVLLGEVTREEIEAAVPSWVSAEVEAEPDPQAARALTEVEPGARVTVYLGTWCADSRRELARLWRAFDEIGVLDPAELPFELEYVGVGRGKDEPADRLAGVGLRYVPTFVVARGGREVGRMVEVSPHGIEHDLLALLRGEAEGVVTARDDAAELAGPETPGSRR